MLYQLTLSVAIALTSAACTNASANTKHQRALHQQIDICSQPDQSELTANALECFSVKVDLSAFNLNTPKGLESAKDHLEQLSHRACRIPNATPSGTDKQIYDDCRAHVIASASKVLTAAQSRSER